jgi:hypothetical protein
MSDEEPVVVPSVAIELREQVDRLREFAYELDDYYWAGISSGADEDDRRYQVRVWSGQLASRRALLEDIARHKGGADVLVPVGSLGEARELLDAVDALDVAVGRDDLFDAVYLKAARVLAAADRISLAAARGRAHPAASEA